MSNKTITETVREMTESAIKAGLPVQPMPDSVSETAESVTEITDSVNEASESEPVTPEIVNDDNPGVIEPKTLALVQQHEWNYEEMKSNLTAHIAKYANLVVTDQNLKSMEKTQKEIAGLRINLAKFRTKIKQELEKPFKVFDHQFKELTELVATVEKPIKDQLEIYEQKRREVKAVIVQEIINQASADLGLEEKYSSQIAIADTWLNRGTSKKAITEEVQLKVCWFLEIQQKDKSDEAFKQEKIEMAKFMCESLSVGLVTPLRFEEVESRLDSMDVIQLKKYITDEVARRKEREDRAAKLAMEQAEQKRNDPPLPPPQSFDPPMPPVPPVPSQTGLPPMPPTAPRFNTPPMPPIAQTVDEWNCNMRITNATVAQMEELKAFMTAKGIQYSFNGYERSN